MDHLLDDEERPRHERELTLSTGAILGIFLGLAVLCGAFFGFGYNMGRKSAPTPLNLSDVNTDASLGASASTAPAKPAAGTPLTPSISGDSSPAPATPRPAHKPAPLPEAALSSSGSEAPSTEGASAKITRTLPPANSSTSLPAPIVRQPAPVSPSALNPSVPASTASTAGSPGNSYMVQVAAVSHREDADLLIGALRARGYAVSARSGSSDNFIHVQVGPFHDKQSADAMRQRLLTDGYNAIVKQ